MPKEKQKSSARAHPYSKKPNKKQTISSTATIFKSVPEIKSINAARALVSLEQEKPSSDPIVFHKECTEIQLYPARMYHAALLLTLEDTVLNLEASKTKQEIILNQAEKFRTLIARAVKCDILVALCTLEEYASSDAPKYLNIKNVARSIGGVRSIFYVEKGKKAEIMRYLQNNCYVPQHNMLLLDKSETEVANARKEFVALQFDPKNPNHSLNVLTKFIEKIEEQQTRAELHQQIQYTQFSPI